jgi:hypothetical protein
MNCCATVLLRYYGNATGCIGHVTKENPICHHIYIYIYIYIYICLQRVRLPDREDVNSKQFEFTLLDGSRCLHISESTVSISYTLRYQTALASQVKDRKKQ